MELGGRRPSIVVLWLLKMRLLTPRSRADFLLFNSITAYNLLKYNILLPSSCQFIYSIIPYCLK